MNACYLLLLYLFFDASMNTSGTTPDHVRTVTPDNMVFVQGGEFKMGDQYAEGNRDEIPVHSVFLSDFYMGKFEVTFDEFDAFCAATGKDKPSDNGWGRGRRPVINVDWYDAVEYCNWLSQHEKLVPVYAIDKNSKDPNNQSAYEDKRWKVSADFSANGYRLPTEAEWEYAAREGGKKLRFGNGKEVVDPKEVNCYASNNVILKYSIAGEDRGETVPVDELSANSLGFKHLSGNVWEWCWDWYGDKYYTESEGARNPCGPDSGLFRVARGGAWICFPDLCRAAKRAGRGAEVHSTTLGFRVARHL